MGDIVKHLRIRAQRETSTGITEPHEHIDWMAADEIERLREENARLVDILDDVLAQWDGDWPEELYERVKAAIQKGAKDG